MMYPVATERAMQAELAAGRADIAAAQMTATPEWRRVGDASSHTARIPQLVVYRRDARRPRGTLQLESAKLAVRAGSPQEQTLEKLKKTVAPTLQWVETAPNKADPLADVDSGEADYAIIDEREFSFAHHLYPNVHLGFTLPEERPVQWIVRRGAHDLLTATNRSSDNSGVGPHGQAAARRPAMRGRSSTKSHANSRPTCPNGCPVPASVRSRVGADRHRLAPARGDRLPGIEVEPARQHPGRRLGMMMLTSDTAQAMGIKDRSNPAQNISAGARYFAEVREKIPDRIPEPDRTWFTVAAYNVGFGHLEDARVLAQTHGKNPDSWADVRDQLPRSARSGGIRR